MRKIFLIKFRSEWIAVFIAILALFLTVWQSSMTRVHNELSVKPYINVTIEDTKNKEISFQIENVGIGPAIIEDIIFKYAISAGDTNYYSFKKLEDIMNFRRDYYSVLPDIRPNFIDVEVFHIDESNTLVLSTSSSITIFKAFVSQEDEIFESLKRIHFSGIEVSVIYKDFYNNRFQTDYK